MVIISSAQEFLCLIACVCLCDYKLFSLSLFLSLYLSIYSLINFVVIDCWNSMCTAGSSCDIPSKSHTHRNEIGFFRHNILITLAPASLGLLSIRMLLEEKAFWS